MRTTAAHQNLKEEQHHIVWELDGGGSNRHHEVILFEGRLYSSLIAVRFAKIKSRARRATRLIAGYVPFFLA